MKNGGSVPGWQFQLRTQRSVCDIHSELGKTHYFRSAYYQMTYRTFKRLVALFCPHINAACGKKGTTRFCWNGQNSPDIRLACAICWFSAGGLPFDMMTNFGISHTDTIVRFWYIVDTINWHSSSAIVHPDNHDQQRSIA